MKKTGKQNIRWNTMKILAVGFLSVIFLGAVLLWLPVSNEKSISFLDALFTSTSSVCVTGLVTIVPKYQFTITGKVILLILIQIGGLGVIACITAFFMLLKRKITVKERVVIQEAYNMNSLGGLVGLVRKILIGTVVVEGIGAVFYAIQFIRDYGVAKGIWYGIFHSISAFNNAGFSLFTDNMIGYKDDTIVLVTICFLIILGGLGYFVIIELHENKKFAKRITIHTRIVIIGTVVLILFGMIIFLSIEWNNQKTFGEFDTYTKILNSFFLSVNFRTAGFNSMDLSGLKDSSLFYSTLLMMIGAGQGGTAGGMKITVIAVLIIMVFFVLKQSNQEPHIFKRTIEQKLINKAAAIVMFSSAYVLFVTLLLVETQDYPFVRILFEVVSAFCTVGVSVGDGGILSLATLFDDFGKSIIIISMIAGRLGVFAFGLLIVGKAKTTHF